MRKALKLVFIIIMLVGIVLSILNFISVENMAYGTPPMPGAGYIGTQGPMGPLDCTGPALNC